MYRHSHNMKEGMQTNMSYNVATGNPVPDNDPLYSVLDNETSNCYTDPPDLPTSNPPKLPTSRPPYYEEIDSDLAGMPRAAVTPMEYEQPIKTSPTQIAMKSINSKKLFQRMLRLI